jgi:hypothetical protein
MLHKSWPLGSLNSHTRFIFIIFTENHVNDIIVFCVGLVVSSLVIYGVFSSVVLEMHEAKNQGGTPSKSENQPF